MRIELRVVKWIIKQRIHFNIMRHVMGWVITSVKDTRDSGRTLTNTETMRHTERIRRASKQEPRLNRSFRLHNTPLRLFWNVGETMTNQLSHPLQISFEPYLGYRTLLPLRGVGDVRMSDSLSVSSRRLTENGQ